MPLWPQRLYYAAIIATCQVNEASLTLDTLQLSRSNVNSVVRSYLSPTPVGVGVGTSLIWAVDQTLLPGESGYARLHLLVGSYIPLGLHETNPPSFHKCAKWPVKCDK